MTSYHSNHICTYLSVNRYENKGELRGEQFDVTYDKLFRTSEGMGFVLKREEDIDSRMMEVFGTDIHIHLANVGCAIFFKNEPRNH